MKKRWLLLIVLVLSGVNIQAKTLWPEVSAANAEVLNTPVSSRMNRALTHYQSGEYAGAIALWQALINDPQVAGDRLRLGQLWNYVSLGQQKLAQWENAAESIRRSLAYLTPSPQAQMTAGHQQSYAQALTTQGHLYLEMGNTTAAVEIWQNSEQLYRTLKDDLGTRGSLINQAIALEQGGFYRRACLTLLEAVQFENRCEFPDASPETVREIFPALTRLESPPLRAIALHTFVNILLQLGELDWAATAIDLEQTFDPQSPHMRQSFQFTQASLSVAKYQALEQEESRARSHRLAQRLQTRMIIQANQVKREYQTLLQFLDQSTGQDNITSYQAQVDYLTFLVDYTTWLQANQRASDAESDQIQQQIQQLRIQPRPQTFHRAVKVAHIKQAETLITLLDRDSSQSARLRADIIELLQSVLQGSSAPDWASHSGESQIRAFAQGALGSFYEVQQQWPQAEKFTQLALSQAQSVQNAAVSYRWQWQLGRILAAQGKRDRAIQAYEQALITLQSIRKDLLSLNRNAQFSFRDQIEPSYRELVGLLLSSPNPDHRSLTSARQVIDRLQVSEVEDFLLQNCINASLASLDSYIEREASQSALLYTIIQDESVDIIVKIPNTDQIQFHRVNQSKAEFETFLTTYRRSLQQKLPSTQQRSQDQGQQLYQWLVQPFQAEFQRQNIDTLVFVLDGSLRDIPMATLHDGDRYLIEQYAVAVTPGLQILEASRPSLRSQQRAVVAGASQGNPRLGLSALPAIRKEIQQIESALPQADILLDHDFTEMALKNLIQAQAAPIIHIATHGQFSSNPDETFLVTGTGERIDLSDLGTLLRQRTRSQSQTLELLFLSACQTLAGDRWAALGMAGVAIRSGAQSTIASIWNADDEASAELVSRFYVHLTAQPGRTKAEALRLAQVEMLKNPRYDLPVYWSPYVLIGNWQ